jgi:DNA-binding response OmpR family regulator
MAGCEVNLFPGSDDEPGVPGSQTILLLDGFEVALGTLTDRLRALQHRAIRARTADEAVQLAHGNAVGAVVLPSDLRLGDVAALVRALRSCPTGASMTFLSAGPEPRPDARDDLREIGVRIALWEPFDGALLRYQINRALASMAGRRPRAALRVPCNVPARARTGEREKPGRVYTLSERGLFFETPRASMRGVDVALELRIGAQVLPAQGRVALSNVPGNLRDPRLPVGIGVRFTEISDHSVHVIRQAVASIAPILDV